MKLIVGLGNPGDKYKNTRHNIGYQILSSFKTLMGLNDLSFNEDKYLLGHIAKNNELALLKPTTFMNNSGQSVIKTMARFSVKKDDLIVIHDDLDLPFGAIKIQYNKNAAGHHGVESIIQYLQTKEFYRLRFGIAGEVEKTIPGDKYVLSKFSEEEEEILDQQILIAANELKKWIDQQ